MGTREPIQELKAIEPTEFAQAATAISTVTTIILKEKRFAGIKNGIIAIGIQISL